MRSGGYAVASGCASRFAFGDGPGVVSNVSKRHCEGYPCFMGGELCVCWPSDGFIAV